MPLMRICAETASVEMIARTARTGSSRPRKIAAGSVDMRGAGSSILHFGFQRLLPVEHYHDSWGVKAGAMQLAAILHLVIVSSSGPLSAGIGLYRFDTAKVDVRTNVILVVLSSKQMHPKPCRRLSRPFN